MLPYAGAMTPLILDSTLALLVDEPTGLENPEYGAYCINAASILAAEAAGRPDWLGLGPLGEDIAPVPAPRLAVMYAEQLAKRAYLNPNAIVSEGGIGPLGGDRTVEDFARTFEWTPSEAAYFEEVKRLTGIVDGGAGATALWTLEIENRPYPAAWATIYLNGVDPREQPWPVGTEGAWDAFMYGPAI